MKKSWQISRRTLLQSTAGTAIALPVLEAMIGSDAHAEGKPIPKRILHYHGLIYGYVGRNDPELNTLSAPWTSTATGYDNPIQNNTYLKPFFDKSLQSKITILTGITDPVLRGTHDSPVKAVANTFPLARADGGCVILTANPNDPGVFASALSEPDPWDGATVDQIAAKAIGGDTPIPSLTMAVQKVGGAFNQWPMSYKKAGQGIPAIADPLEAFKLLFGTYDPSATIEDVKRRALYRKSVLDGVRDDAARLHARLGRSDQDRLDGYLDSVRNLEKLVEASSQGTPIDVEAPGDSDSYGTLELKLRAMQDLIVNAFITDRTRVIAFSGPFAGSWLKLRGSGQTDLDYSKYRQFNGDPLSGSHHSMSHTDQGSSGSAPSAAITAMKRQHMEIYSHWTLEMYSELLAKLDAHVEFDGTTTLDNTIAIWGGDDSDSTKHGWKSMPCVIGGLGGGKIKAGRQLRFGAFGSAGERTWKDLLWGALNIVGVPGLHKFGYATKALDTALGT